MSMNAPMDVLNYNVPWFQEAGIEVPWQPQTLDDVYDALTKLKAARSDVPLAVQAKPDEGVTMLKTLLEAAGTPFDGARPDLTSPGGQYVLDFFIRAEHDGLLPPNAVSWGEAETRGGFLQGKVGILEDSQGAAYDFSQADGFAYPDQWATAVIPTDTGAGTTGVTITAAKTWAITAGTKHAYEASLAMRYLASAKVQVGTMVDLGGSPARNSTALADPSLTEAWPYFTDAERTAFAGSAPAPSGEDQGPVESVLTDMFDEIVSGTDKSAEEIAKEYQPKVDDAK
jgi:multiple sugar transport system substrate-binding protein